MSKEKGLYDHVSLVANIISAIVGILSLWQAGVFKWVIDIFKGVQLSNETIPNLIKTVFIILGVILVNKISNYYFKKKNNKIEQELLSSRAANINENNKAVEQLRNAVDNILIHKPPLKIPFAYDLEAELEDEISIGRSVDIKLPPERKEIKTINLSDILTGRWQHEYTLPSGYKGPSTLVEIKEDKWYEDHIHKFNIEDFSIAEDKTSMNFSKVSLDKSFRGVYILFTKDSKIWAGQESGYAKIKLTKVS